jgi:hypothetical protein
MFEINIISKKIMNTTEYYRNFRNLMNKYTNWNLYADTDAYSTDFFLSFKDAKLNTKFEAQNKANYSIKLIIAVSLISYITSEVWYYPNDIGIWFIVCVMAHWCAFYTMHKGQDYSKTRSMMEVVLLVIHMGNIFRVDKIPSLFIFSPIIIFDILLAKTWKKHLMILVIHISLVNIFVYLYTFIEVDLKDIESVLVLDGFLSIFKLTILLLFDVIIFAAIEKFVKENWVLKTTFDRSFKTMLYVIDSSQEKMIICNQKGSIIFSNSAFINNIPWLERDDIKITSHVDDKCKDALYKAINSVIKSAKTTSIVVSLRHMAENEDEGKFYK